MERASHGEVVSVEVLTENEALEVSGRYTAPTVDAPVWSGGRTFSSLEDFQMQSQEVCR